jgi:hypothetical protein
MDKSADSTSKRILGQNNHIDPWTRLAYFLILSSIIF